MKIKLTELAGAEIDESLIPPDFDKKIVPGLLKASEQSMKANAAASVDEAQPRTDLLQQMTDPSLFECDPKRAKKATREAKPLANEEPDAAQPTSGHNPWLFPPLSSLGRTVEGGGSVDTARNRHRPNIGELSSSVYAVVPAGRISRSQFMGR